MDFMHDQLHDGGRLRVLTVVDQYTREALATEARASFSAHDVIDVLNRLSRSHRKPAVIQVDNGTEFASRALDAWAYREDVRLDLSHPGRATNNAHIESFNARLRAECLNAHVFESLEDAAEALTSWRSDYNAVRPHSALGMLTPRAFAEFGQRNAVRRWPEFLAARVASRRGEDHADWRIMEDRIATNHAALDNRMVQYMWGQRYIDDCVLHRVDVNLDGDYVDLDGDVDEDVYHHLTDAMFSTVALMRGSVVVERVTYDPYGKPLRHAVSDLTGDGSTTTADTAVITGTAWGSVLGGSGAGSYNSLADVDRDADVDTYDHSAHLGICEADTYPAALSNGDNLVGFDGYIHDQEAEQYTVRHRACDPAIGRWVERDPIAYFDSANNYQYCMGQPGQSVDTFGLSACAAGSGGGCMPAHPLGTWPRPEPGKQRVECYTMEESGWCEQECTNRNRRAIPRGRTINGFVDRTPSGEPIACCICTGAARYNYDYKRPDAPGHSTPGTDAEHAQAVNVLIGCVTIYDGEHTKQCGGSEDCAECIAWRVYAACLCDARSTCPRGALRGSHR